GWGAEHQAGKFQHPTVQGWGAEHKPENSSIRRSKVGEQSNLQGDIALIDSKYGLTGAAAAAELVRIFRNHIFHGKDNTPLSGGLAMVSHFYAATRLLLMLIQNILLLKARDIESDIPLSLAIEERGYRPARFLILNLHRPEAQWAPNSTR
ncbi:hypothetical protein, partial [Paracoccus sp. S4493]|uniref:hypothetical protein n=1 Tax=Paracoccus sp. S4493 TaxID=579490 RepID=UPI00138E3118